MKDSPEIETEGIDGEMLCQPLLVNGIFVTDRELADAKRRVRSGQYPMEP